MKFTDGNWMMQPGVIAHYPAEVYEAEIRAQAARNREKSHDTE